VDRHVLLLELYMSNDPFDRQSNYRFMKIKHVFNNSSRIKANFDS
jgi:hypothetical protein